MSELLFNQWCFARMVPRLIDKAHELGFEVTGGHWWRSPTCTVGKPTSFHKKKLAIVGSDAHIPYEYGRSYVRIPLFKNNSPETFKDSLSASELVTHNSPLWVHLITKWVKVKKRVESGKSRTV